MKATESTNYWMNRVTSEKAAAARATRLAKRAARRDLAGTTLFALALIVIAAAWEWGIAWTPVREYGLIMLTYPEVWVLGGIFSFIGLGACWQGWKIGR